MITRFMATDIRKIVTTTDAYNLHSHSQFCDGRDTMEAIAAAAEAVFKLSSMDFPFRTEAI